MSDSVNPIRSSRRFVGFQRGAAICAVVLLWTMSAPGVGAQQRVRANRFIEALEAGQPAMTGETWTFIDREHRPYSIDEIQSTLNKIFANKNDKGQVTLAPIVRIPMIAFRRHPRTLAIRRGSDDKPMHSLQAPANGKR